MIGAANMALIVASPATLVTLGAFTWRVGLGLLGLLLMGGLMLRKYRSAFLISILSICVVSVILRAIIDRDLVLDPFGT